MSPEQEKKLDVCIAKQDKLYTFLVGDEELKTTGLKQQVDFHSKKILEFSNDKIKERTIMSMIGGAMGVAGTYLAHLFKH